MSQRSLCSNVQQILKPPKASARLSLASPACSTNVVSKKSIIQRAASCATVSSPRRIQPHSSFSTPLAKRSFASSSRVHAWTPARTLDRSHPAAPTNNKMVVEHLRTTFPPLEFPEDVALRIITHASWQGGAEGHNARLAFIGRRVMECYLNLFLHSQTESGLSKPHSFDHINYDEFAKKVLDTHVLGEFVGSAWQLERIMRWVPSHTNDPSRTMWSSGLYRVRGTTVEALLGGVFHQFGGAVAHQLFHTRVLPHLAAAKMLPISDPIRAGMEEASKAYGGAGAPLTPDRIH